MTASPTIAFDFDSVAYPLLHAMAKLPGGERVAYHTCPSWNGLADQCEGGLHGMLALFEAAMTYQAMSDTGLFPGAIEGMNQIRARTRVHLMTERPAVVADDTRRFVSETLCPDAITVAQPFDKIALCRQLGISLIVEDNPKTIEAAHAAGMTVVCVRYRFNAEVLDRLALPYVTLTDSAGQLRPGGWQQLTRLVLEHL